MFSHPPMIYNTHEWNGLHMYTEYGFIKPLQIASNTSKMWVYASNMRTSLQKPAGKKSKLYTIIEYYLNDCNGKWQPQRVVAWIA